MSLASFLRIRSALCWSSPVCAFALALVLALGVKAADSGSSDKDLRKQLSQTSQALEALAPPDHLVNPEHRAALKETVMPLLTKALDLHEQLLSTATPKARTGILYSISRDRALLAFYGDDSAAAVLQKQSKERDATLAAAAKTGLKLVQWWNAAGNADVQGKLLEQMKAMSHVRKSDDGLALAVKAMMEANPASVELQSEGDDIICAMKGPWARVYATHPLHLGKHFAVDGDKFDGGKFSTDDWKGKVIMVDFWATWCPPCRAEYPHVAELYRKYHSQGLEIIGVSSDTSRDALAAWEQKHSESTWPQLFVTGVKTFHPLALSYGISEIPTVYLIDRHGVLRTILGRAEMDELIPKLLAE